MRKLRGRWAIVPLIALVLAIAGCGGGDDDQAEGDTPSGFNAEEFFAGKTIRVIVTHSAGGGSDLYGRFVAGKLGDYIPGKPRVTVTNESGVGGMGTVYDAPEAEMVIGVSSQGSTLYTAALDPEGAGIDASKIRMIGGTGGDPRAVTVFGDLAAAWTDIKDFSGKDGPVFKWAYTVGAPVDLVSDSFFASWLCDNLDLPCQMVSVADDDSSDLNLMIARGELTALSSSELSTLRDNLADLKSGKTVIAFTHSPDENTEIVPPSGIEIPDIATLLPEDLVDDYEAIVPIIGGGAVGKHMWLGPDWSDDALEVLRQAYSDLVSDPAVVTELQKVMSGEGSSDFQYIVSAVDGADAQALYDEAAGTFSSNLSNYEDLQKKYYDTYWK